MWAPVMPGVIKASGGTFIRVFWKARFVNIGVWIQISWLSLLPCFVNPSFLGDRGLGEESVFQVLSWI
jgi:hypothetical protein